MNDDRSRKAAGPRRAAGTRRAPPAAGTPLPRRPDERDESPSSQRSESPQSQRDMQLAHDDLAAGRRDTDARRAESDRAMRRLQDGAPVPAAAQGPTAARPRHRTKSVERKR